MTPGMVRAGAGGGGLVATGNASCRRGNTLGPTAPPESKEEPEEGVPKNLELSRDSCHWCAIHRMPRAPSQGRVNYLPPLVPMGNQAGNEQRQAPAYFALFCLEKPTVLSPKLGSGAGMWNFPRKLQNHHGEGKTFEN